MERATRIMIYALAATSLNLVLGYGGMISFGHAAFFGAGAYNGGDSRQGRARSGTRCLAPGRSSQRCARSSSGRSACARGASTSS